MNLPRITFNAPVTLSFFLISLIAFVPAIFVLTAIPHLVERFPEYYSEKNRIERRLDKLTKKRFERFKKMKAPIHSGIWVEQHEMERPYDFDGIYLYFISPSFYNNCVMIC